MNIYDLKSNSTIIYQHEEIIQAINAIALNLNKVFCNNKVLVLPVMTGAIPFAGHLIPKLTFDVELGYFHASRYQNNKGNKDIKLIYEPPKEKIQAKSVLLLDDILDEGYTLSYIKGRLKMHGATSVETAVLFDKAKDKNKPLTAKFVGLKIPDIYVYGFGLDFKGIGRNMPHLYAYKN